MYNKESMKGFTFIELLLVVLLLGGLMLFFLPRYTQSVKRQHQTHMKVLQDARNLQNQLKARQELEQRQLDQLERSLQRPAHKR